MLVKMGIQKHDRKDARKTREKTREKTARKETLLMDNVVTTICVALRLNFAFLESIKCGSA